MARGNDAIPSWSGFNYQGKIVLLTVVREINELLRNGGDISLYQVELEKTEDFVLQENDLPKALYQVKATLSKSKWGQYQDALDKLLKHRSDAGNLAAKCYLVVANEIIDWSDVTNPYGSKVDIYKYGADIVEISKVKECIYAEISTALSLLGKATGLVETIYGNLCVFLDDKVADMHVSGKRDRDYRIKLKNFYDLINSSVDRINDETRFRLKEKVFEHMIGVVDYSMNEICMATCGSDYCECTKNCAVKRAYEELIQLNDLTMYCKLINPSKRDSWDDELTFCERFSRDDIKEKIFKLFLVSNSPDLVVGVQDAVGMKSFLCKIPNGIVIPTLLSFRDSFSNKDESMQRVFQSIQDNSEAIHALSGNSITADGQHSVFETISQADITTKWNQCEADRIDCGLGDIEIISLQELLRRFSEEGGNHE